MKNLIASLLVLAAASVASASSTVCNHQNDPGIMSNTNPPAPKNKPGSPRSLPVQTQGNTGING